MENYFAKLNDINVTKKIEKRNGLNYLSWAYAWAEVKKQHPTAQYKIYENDNGWNYFTDRRTCWVKVSVTIDDLEHIEYLPIMDTRNRSIPLDVVTSFDVNKAIQRAITKACARHGLGLYIYAGEDLPESENSPGNKPEVDDLSKLPPTLEQIGELNKVKRSLSDVAKNLGIELSAVNAQHVAEYIKKVSEYQKEKEAKKLAELEKEANTIFTAAESES